MARSTSACSARACSVRASATSVAACRELRARASAIAVASAASARACAARSANGSGGGGASGSGVHAATSGPGRPARPTAAPHDGRPSRAVILPGPGHPVGRTMPARTQAVRADEIRLATTQGERPQQQGAARARSANAQAARRRLEPVVADAVARAGFELEQVDVQQAGRTQLVKVVVDGDDGIGLDEVADVSRARRPRRWTRSDDVLGRRLHARGHLAGAGPAADQTEALAPRAAAHGAVRTAEDEFIARVGDADDDGVELLVDGQLRRVGYAEIEHAVIEVEFKEPPAAEIAKLAHRGGIEVNVDIAALRAIERDKDIPFDTVIEAIETALLTAYKHTEGHQPHARIDIDRRTGLVRVLAFELGQDGEPRQGVGRHAGGLRPDRRHHRAPGHPAAPAGRREREDLRRVLRQGGRDRRRRRAARRAGQLARHGRGPGR